MESGRMHKGMILTDGDFLSAEEISNLENRIMSQNDTSWVLSKETNVVDDSGMGRTLKDKNVKESFQAVCPIYPLPYAERPRHHMYEEIVEAFNKFIIKNKIFCTKIIRIKINVLTRGESYAPDSYHIPHIDNDEPHMVFLYYVNDSDGDTFFFNEMYSGSEVENLTVKTRVTPSAGTASVFDGYRYHASSSPFKSQYRCIINIDFKGGKL